MYGVVRRVQADATTLQEFVQRIQGVVPELQQVHGFVSFTVLVSGDTLVSISIYQDKAGADQSTAIALRYVRDEWVDLKLNPPEITSGDVPVHAIA